LGHPHFWTSHAFYGWSVGYIKEIMRKYNVTKKECTPSSDNLF
jgi:hypothetical protein